MCSFSGGLWSPVWGGGEKLKLRVSQFQSQFLFKNSFIIRHLRILLNFSEFWWPDYPACSTSLDCLNLAQITSCSVSVRLLTNRGLQCGHCQCCLVVMFKNGIKLWWLRYYWIFYVHLQDWPFELMLSMYWSSKIANSRKQNIKVLLFKACCGFSPKCDIIWQQHTDQNHKTDLTNIKPQRSMEEEKGEECHKR